LAIANSCKAVMLGSFMNDSTKKRSAGANRPLILSCLWLLTCSAIVASETSVDSPTRIELKADQHFRKDFVVRVKELGYADEESSQIADMVFGWRDLLDNVVVISLKNELDDARHKFENHSIAIGEFAGIEEEIAFRLSIRITYEIEGTSLGACASSLVQTAKTKKANCLGFTKLFVVLANAMGIHVQAIKVTDLLEEKMLSGTRHIACLIRLTNGKSVIADLSNRKFTDSFALSDRFKSVSRYWVFRDEKNDQYRFRILTNREWMAVVNFGKAGSLFEEKKYAEAIAQYSRSIADDPKFSDAYSCRGLAHWKLNHAKAANADFDKAIELDPTENIYFLNRAGLYFQLGDNESALVDCERAIAMAPDACVSYANRAMIYLAKGQFQKSMLDLNKAAELYGFQFKATASAIHKWLTGDDLRMLATRRFELESVLDPTNGDVFLFRARVEYQLNDYRCAEDDFRKAEELKPQLTEEILAWKRTLDEDKK
jgi:tetratricopeptide (TPR) repeat protein